MYSLFLSEENALIRAKGLNFRLSGSVHSKVRTGTPSAPTRGSGLTFSQVRALLWMMKR